MIAAALDRLVEASKENASATREWIAFNRERAEESRINEGLQTELYRLQIRKWEADARAAEANAAGAEAVRMALAEGGR